MGVKADMEDKYQLLQEDSSTSRSTVKVVGTILLTVIFLTSVACLVVSLINMKIAADIAENLDFEDLDITRGGLGEACSGTSDCGDSQQCCCEHRPGKEKGLSVESSLYHGDEVCV